MAELIDFKGLPNPFHYLDDPSKFLDYLQKQQKLRSTISMLYWLYYSDERIAIKPKGSRISADGRSYVTGQEIGLPARITGITDFSSFGGISLAVPSSAIKSGDGTTIPDLTLQRKEPFTQNEIGWRVDTVVECLYGELPGGRAFKITSDIKSENETLGLGIEDLLRAVFEAQSEPNWLESFAREAAIYGYVDTVIRLDDSVRVTVDSETKERIETPRMTVDQFAKSIQLYLAPARETVPLPDPKDCNCLGAYVLQYDTVLFPGDTKSDATISWIELYLPGFIRIFKSDPEEEKGKWIQDGDDIIVPEGRMPIIHHQHLWDGRRYEGRGEVESMIPIQDEVNTRLSDRGRGCTYGANPPWFGRGISDFHLTPIAPDRMISSDNEDATLERVSSDSNDDGQNTHLADLFDGLDKISKVPPVAVGMMKDSIGNLTSSTALRTLLRGFLGKISRIREGHDQTIPPICELILVYANDLGVFKTKPEERKTSIEWGDVVEMSSSERLDDALKKKALGVSISQILEEIGYTDEQITAFEGEREREQEEMERKFGIENESRDE